MAVGIGPDLSLRRDRCMMLPGLGLNACNQTSHPFRRRERHASLDASVEPGQEWAPHLRMPE